MNLLELDFERAKAKHILFKTRLRSILFGIEVDETGVLSFHDCELGQWIYNDALERYGHIPEMLELERVHQKIHVSAGELVDLYKKGEIEKARDGLTTMEIIAGNLMTLLSVIEVKLKAEQTDEKQMSEQISVNYKELLQLHDTLTTLDQRVRSEIEKSARVGQVHAESENKFRNTVLQAPVGMIILRGRDMVVEMVNDTYLQIVDRREDEMVGRSLFASLPEVEVSVRDILVNILDTGIPFYGNEFEVTLRRAGVREQTFFNFVYQPLLEEGVISGIIVVATEVTSQVRAKHALQQSENQFRNIVMQSQFAKAVFVGEDMVISMANETMLGLWRRGMHEVEGRKLLDVFPELVDQPFPKILGEVYATGVTYRENESVAFVDGPDGVKKYYLDFQYAAMFDGDGNVFGVLASVNNVTEKVEVKRQLNDMIERLSLATNGTKLATWDLDLETREIVYSSRLSELFGQPDSEILTHQQMRNQVHPDDLPIVESAFEEALKTGTYYYEVRIVHPAGTFNWVRTQGKVLFDSDHKAYRMLGTMMDITERKRAERIIEASEKRYRDLIDTLPVAVYTVDENGFVNLYNKAAVELWGREPELEKELWCGAYQTFSMDGHELSEDECPMAIAFREQRALSEESFVKRPDGNLRHVVANPQPIFDGSGQVTGALNVVIDITDRKEVEFALRTSEGKFRTLADSMPQLIWTGDVDGNLNYFSKSVFDYTGLNFEKLRRLGWTRMIHPDDLETYQQRWTDAINSGEEFVFEHRFKRFDGAFRWQLSRAMPQHNEQGLIQMWVGTSTDIHDSKLFIDELESKVQQRTKELTIINDELIRTNIELGQFAYVASHDLQEPLRKIQTFSTRILETENENLSDRGKDYFGRMQASSTRMQQLIVDLLAFSRANAVEKNFETMDLNVLLQNVRDQLQESIQQKGAVITSTKLPVLNVIVYQFEQLFTNLISNALKFVKTGVVPELEITSGIISGKQTGLVDANPNINYHFISFSDNGIGFEQQFHDRIFQVFQRLHNKKSFEGTGIGLAICKKIMDNHQGMIRAIGQPDLGATFIIYIPAI